MDTPSPTGEKKAKLDYWLEYALSRFPQQFWNAFKEMGLANRGQGQLIIHLVEQGRLEPASPFARMEEFEGSGSPKQRNASLDSLMELIARLGIAENPLLRDKTVLEIHHEEKPSKELGKLARKVAGHYNRRPMDFPDFLGQLAVLNRAQQEEYRLGTLSGEAFFEEEYELMQHNHLLMQWRYFIAARNYERTAHLPPYSICKADLLQLNQASRELRSPSPLLLTWQQIANFQEQPSMEAYAELLAALDAAHSSESLQKGELADGYRVALNYLLPQANVSGSAILLEAFNLMKSKIENGLFLQGPLIHPRDLKNLISICLRLGKTKEARRFFDSFQDRILDDPKDHARDYNAAVVLFGEGHFQKAGAAFVKVMYASEDFYLKTDGKIYALRCLIELQVAAMDGTVDFFPGSDESFKMFFRRQKGLPEAIYQYYLDIFKILLEFKGIWGSLAYERRDRWLALQESIQDWSDPYLKNWLDNKIDQCLAFIP